MSTRRYNVVIVDFGEVQFGDAVERVAESFGISERKAAKFCRNFPVVVRKAASSKSARSYLFTLTRIGATVRLDPIDVEAADGEDPSTAEPADASPAAPQAANAIAEKEPASSSDESKDGGSERKQQSAPWNLEVKGSRAFETGEFQALDGPPRQSAPSRKPVATDARSSSAFEAVVLQDDEELGKGSSSFGDAAVGRAAAISQTLPIAPQGAQWPRAEQDDADDDEAAAVEREADEPSELETTADIVLPKRSSGSVPPGADALMGAEVAKQRPQSDDPGTRTLLGYTPSGGVDAVGSPQPHLPSGELPAPVRPELPSSAAARDLKLSGAVVTPADAVKFGLTEPAGTGGYDAVVEPSDGDERDEGAGSDAMVEGRSEGIDFDDSIFDAYDVGMQPPDEEPESAREEPGLVPAPDGFEAALEAAARATEEAEATGEYEQVAADEQGMIARQARSGEVARAAKFRDPGKVSGPWQTIDTADDVEDTIAGAAGMAEKGTGGGGDEAGEPSFDPADRSAIAAAQRQLFGTPPPRREEVARPAGLGERAADDAESDPFGDVDFDDADAGDEKGRSEALDLGGYEVDGGISGLSDIEISSSGFQISGNEVPVGTDAGVDDAFDRSDALSLHGEEQGEEAERDAVRSDDGEGGDGLDIEAASRSSDADAEDEPARDSYPHETSPAVISPFERDVARGDAIRADDARRAKRSPGRGVAFAALVGLIAGAVLFGGIFLGMRILGDDSATGTDFDAALSRVRSEYLPNTGSTGMRTEAILAAGQDVEIDVALLAGRCSAYVIIGEGACVLNGSLLVEGVPVMSLAPVGGHHAAYACAARSSSASLQVENGALSECRIRVAGYERDVAERDPQAAAIDMHARIFGGVDLIPIAPTTVQRVAPEAPISLQLTLDEPGCYVLVAQSSLLSRLRVELEGGRSLIDEAGGTLAVSEVCRDAAAEVPLTLRTLQRAGSVAWRLYRR